MLFLLFSLGHDRYALDVTRVAEVLPLVDIKQIPRAPRGVAGVMNYRGTPVPVIDLSDLALGRPAQRLMSTRLVLVHYVKTEDGEKAESKHLLGLIAEQATETLRRELTEFSASGISNRDTPYLGPVTTDNRGLIQRVEVNELLSTSVHDLLFKQSMDHS